MGEKINVSYIAIFGYVIFVIGSSLLVGLLPPFVNRPECKPNKEKTLVENNPPVVEPRVLSKNTATLLENVHKRLESKKQDKKAKLNDPIEFLLDNTKASKARPRKNTKNIVERFRNANLEHPARMPFLKQKLGTAVREISICPEIAAPVVGTPYPWYDERLPDYIIPTMYNIELFVPQW
jgi:hypothetical protein